jgi:hypothetical protein
MRLCVATKFRQVSDISQGYKTFVLCLEIQVSPVCATTSHQSPSQSRAFILIIRLIPLMSDPSSVVGFTLSCFSSFMTYPGLQAVCLHRPHRLSESRWCQAVLHPQTHCAS